MEENCCKILTKIQEAEAILIGASNGLSISEGIHIFTDNSSLRKDFGDFGRTSIRTGCNEGLSD